MNKTPGSDGISFTVLKDFFDALYKPLLRVFNLSIVERVFPDDLKTVPVTPVSKEVMRRT